MREVSFAQAQALLSDAAFALPGEEVALDEALGRVLAREVFSDIDMPPFAASTMDGYACRRQDLPGDLTPIEEIPAGRMPERPIGPKQCARIMTGAPLPAGADCVLKQEDCELLGDGRIRSGGGFLRAHVRGRAEELAVGERVLSAGELLTPAHLALLATVGCARPLVFRRPRVTVFATGSELVSPERKPTGAQIRNSNSFQLSAQARSMGALARNGGQLPDRDQVLEAALEKASETSELVLFSGGVAGGDYDLVPGLLARAGFEILFEGVAMQPGRRMVFGRREGVFACGLSGNPAGNFIAFELLLKPLLVELMGHAYRPPLVLARLAADQRPPKPGLHTTLPMRYLRPGLVEVIPHCRTGRKLSREFLAQALWTLPQDLHEIRAGMLIQVLDLGLAKSPSLG